MAVSYKSLKCDCCAGALEYNKEKKVWVCQYCGNEIRREEEYDGLYTIKNVVRQTIMDTAYGRLDGARNNLAECEKMASRYIGTVIARLCVQMFTLTTPGACPPGNEKRLIAQLKKGYEELNEMGEGITAEEEGLYESFENSADVFGVLVLVFDSLGDTVHRDFAENLLRVSEVYSVTVNDSLLRYAVKNKKKSLTDQILGNADNISCKKALMTVLNDYPDGEEKREHLRRIAPRAELVPDDRKLVETYLKESKDSPETRICMYREGVHQKAVPSIEYVTEYLLETSDNQEEMVREIISLICESRPQDVQLYYLVDRIFQVHPQGMALAELKELEKSGIYLAISAKNVSAMLNRSDLTGEEKLELLEQVHHWKLDARANDSILSEYLNRNQDSAEQRQPVIEKLLSYVETISTAALTQYVLGCSTDGEKKAEILQMLLELNLNLSFFGDLLKDYMKCGGDLPETRSRIIALLSEKGLKVDGQALVDMVLAADEESLDETAAFVQKMVSGGVRLPNNALSIYLEKAKDHRYHSPIIRLLHQPSGILSAEALSSYVLYCRDIGTVKAQNALVFSEQCGQPFGSAPCTVRHLGNEIRCNLMQGYVLTTEDDPETARALVNAMKNAKSKLNPPIVAGGETVKFKKYITDHRQELSGLTEQLCTENKVFTLLF